MQTVTGSDDDDDQQPASSGGHHRTITLAVVKAALAITDLATLAGPHDHAALTTMVIIMRAALTAAEIALTTYHGRQR